MTKPFEPFANEAQALEIDGVKIENRLDRVAFYGSTDVTKDKEGLAKARAMLSLLQDVVRVLESERGLPDSIGTDPAAVSEAGRDPFA